MNFKNFKYVQGIFFISRIKFIPWSLLLAVQAMWLMEHALYDCWLVHAPRRSGVQLFLVLDCESTLDSLNILGRVIVKLRER